MEFQTQTRIVANKTKYFSWGIQRKLLFIGEELFKEVVNFLLKKDIII